MIYLAVILNPNSTPGKLCKFWTGLPAYHCGFLDMEGQMFYDMHLLMRRRPWPWPLYTTSQVALFPTLVTKETLESALSSELGTYGYLDYLMFALRPFFHLFGRSTPNAGGLICSELCNNLLVCSGHNTPWDSGDAPPSPADLYRYFAAQQQPIMAFDGTKTMQQ